LACSLELGLGPELKKYLNFQTQLGINIFWLGPGRDLLHFPFNALAYSLGLGLGPELQKCLHFQAQLEIDAFWLGPCLGFCISLLVPWPVVWSWVWDLSCKSTSTFKPTWNQHFLVGSWPWPLHFPVGALAFSLELGLRPEVQKHFTRDQIGK